ncbi:MAG TPA: hypothetical protein GX008_07665 [Firmicutes bacterium]|nr:hypothetical protein [Bacillota bacterium]
MYRKAVLYMLLIGVLTLSPASGLLRWLGDQPTVQAWSEPTYTAPWSEGPLTNEQPGNESEEQVEEQQEEQEPEQGTGLWSEQLDLYPEQPVDEAMLDFERLYGTWYIWTPSSATNLFSTDTGEYVTHDLTPGAQQGVVVIDPSGTYTISHGAWGGSQVVEGTWRLSFPGEINGEQLIAIILLDGPTAVDWAVAPSPSGKVRLLWATEWSGGAPLWVFDSELYQE